MVEPLDRRAARSSSRSIVEPLEARIAPAVTIVNVDSFLTDADSDLKGDPGDVIHYTVTVTNTGPGALTGMSFQDIISDPHLTLVPGSINVSPLAVDDAFNAVGNTTLRVGGSAGTGPEVFVAGGSVIANDFEFLGDAFTLTPIVNGTTALGGKVNLAADGTFTYLSEAGDTGNDSFSYTLSDAGGLTSTGTVNISLTGVIWYVDGSVGATGTGTSSSPFKTLGEVSGATGPDQANQTIYVAAGTYTGGITLLNGQTLWGSGDALTATLPAGTPTGLVTLKTAGTDPVITNAGGHGVTVANGATLKGFTVGNTTGFDISNTTTVAAGTVNISNVLLNGTGGLLNLDATTTLNATFDAMSTTSASANGIHLVNVGGSLGLVAGGTVTMSGVTGTAVNVSGGAVNINLLNLTLSSIGSAGVVLTTHTGSFDANANFQTVAGNDVSVVNGSGNVTISGTINNTANRAVNVDNHDSGNVTISANITGSGGTGINVVNNGGGTILFSGTTKTLSTGATDAVTLTNNAGATINFTGGGLAITTTGAGVGFNATGGATAITVQGANNTITSATGTALNVANSTIGASGLTFQSISANGGTSGIVLNNTSGNLTVTGDGTGRANGSGGSISNITGSALGNAPVYLLTASGTITLNSMNMSLNASSPTSSAFSGMLVDNNAGGTIAVNVTGCTFVGKSAGPAGDQNTTQNKSLLQFEAGGAASLTANVQNSFFFANRTYGLFATGAGTSTVNVTVNQCGFGTEVNTGAPVNQPGTTITNPPPFSLGITNGSSAKVTYNVTNNTFWGADGLQGAIYAVTISGASTTASATLNGSFNFNKIGKATVTGSGASNGAGGLGLLPGTSGQFHATVTGNDIRQVNSVGIDFFNSAGGGASIDGTLKVKGNTLAEPDTTGSPLFQRAIAVSPGNSGGANNPWIAEIGDTTGTNAANKNTITGAWGGQNGQIIRVTNLNNTPALTLPGLTPASGATVAQVQTFVSGANTGVAAAGVSVTLGTGGINGGAPLPLLFSPTSDDVVTPPTQPPVVIVTQPVIVDDGGTTVQPPAVVQPPIVPPPVIVDDGILSQAELDSLVGAAIARWEAAGISAEQSALLHGVSFSVADLPGWYLGEAGAGHVTLDADAAGNAWFIDATPLSDEEFASGTATANGGAAGRLDALTTVMHELGHQLGLDDTYASADAHRLMYGFLHQDERRAGRGARSRRRRAARGRRTRFPVRLDEPEQQRADPAGGQVDHDRL